MKKVNPRRGSLQFWPRVRAKKETAQVRHWAASKEAKPLGFAGYKVGMTHVMYIDNKKTSMTKGQEIFAPVTVIECPPLKIAGIRFYKETHEGLKVVGDVLSTKLDKELSKTISMPKTVSKKIENYTDYDFVNILVYTQPKLTGMGKKKPELFELAIGGNKDEQLNFAKEKLGQEITINDAFTEGQIVDIHAVTRGKGFQGPVKRFGVKVRDHKSEKTIRGPGSLGGWKGHGHFMWRNPLAGKMGYHLRTEYNKWIMKISDKPEEVNPKGGFINFGLVKNNYILVRGSIAGPKKRLITLTNATRLTKNLPHEAPSIEYVSQESKQG